MSLKTLSIQYVKGVGPAKKKLFVNLGIATVEDLLYFFPRRYEDRSRLTPLGNLSAGDYYTVTGTVLVRGARHSRAGSTHIQEVILEDGTARLTCVWFNQPYLERYFRPGVQLVVYGKVEVYKNRLQMASPEYELIDVKDAGLNTGRIVPVYPLTRGMSQRYLRRIIRICLDQYASDIEDILPEPIRMKYRFPPMAQCLESLHFPAGMAQQEEAQRRVSFEEFFVFQLAVMQRRQHIIVKNGFAHQLRRDDFRQFVQCLPFSLTAAQQRVMQEIMRDMQQDTPMLRLLQGDVGSGKTLVAVLACVIAVRNKYQAVIMAPTEILARQHFTKIQQMLCESALKDIRPALLVSGMSRQDREQRYRQIAAGEIDLVIGTHALLNETLHFPALSLVVVDEQHKFGVRQRAVLAEKAQNPDVLVMTATPIPRTLSLTLFGDLDVSVIDEMPPGRGVVTTQLFPPRQASDVYRRVRDAAGAGRQAYIIYPLVEESEKLQLKAAQVMFKRFQRQEFRGLAVALVHGQMSRTETESVMQRFQAGEIKILVATTVLEVGIDVPNASIMVIEHAERFGLSQLHQLRGRIGRGQQDGYCWLVGDAQTDEGRARLTAICATRDGFRVAEEDLRIRGPGHYFGRHQHGLNELRYADPVKAIDILEQARAEAAELMHADSGLQNPTHDHLQDVIRQRFPEYLAMTGAA